MKIYREGREIYEIKDYKQVGKFMEVATIETTIKSTLPIDIKVGDYVIFDYNNLKYTLYDVYPAKKQARSSTYGEAFVYDLKFKADTEHLSICPFLDLVPNDNNLSYSSLPSFSTFENVYGIADRLQANLDYLYPNQWRFDVVDTTDAELLETLSDAREFAISGESCLEGLRKIYDIWGIGFIHSVEDGVNVITIGKSAGKTSMFRYGKGRGLRTIKKNLQNSDQLCTRAYVFGSTRNIPARWYNNKGYIGEAQYAPNLMIPPSKWADGIPQGAYIDAVFDGVNRIEKYGLKIKTLSYDGSDSKKDEIYPSVEKMTAKIIRDAKAEIGENTYIPSPTLYPDNERMDMVLEGSNIADDGTNSEPGYVLHSDKIIKSIEGESETITIAEKKGETKYELLKEARNINICTFDIEKLASYRIREVLDFVTLKKNDLESTISAILTLQTPSGEYIELRKLAFTDKLEDSLQIPDSEHELKEAGKYTLILKLGVTWTTDWVVPQIGEDVYLTYNIAETDITLSRGERILDNFFTIKIKQIGFDINDYTASSGAFKNIHFRSGMCSGMSFNIAKCNYIEEIDAWELKCRRVEDSSISQRFPNSIFNIAKDDRFVLLDINMPDLYVYTAMQRLYDTALEDLKHFSTPQYVIEPQIDNIQMARSPQVLKEGMYMAIDDLDIAILNEEALIDSVTITNRGTDLRSFEVTLRNDKVYNRYNKLADRIADLESTAQKTASNSTITPVQDTSESKIETPAVGFDENALADYLEKNKYTTEGDVTNLLSPIDKEVSTLRTDFDNLNTLLNGNVGGVIDTWNEVVSFLDGYKDSEDLATILSGMNTDIANRVLIEDFEKLEEAVNPLFGYFDANGNANNALKLGGHSAEYFATADALNTHIKAFNTYKTTTDNRLKDLEALWYMDKEGNVHTTHNIVVDGGGAFGKGSGGGGDVPSGGGIDETQLWNILGTSGTQTIHSSHIPDLSGKYLSLSGGVMTGWLDFTENLRIGYLGSALGVHTPYGWSYFGMQNSSWCHIYTDAPAFYMDKPLYVDNGNAVIHSGNIGSYNAGSATKLANKRTLWGREFDGTSNIEGHLYLGYNRDTEAIIYGVNNKTLVYSHKDWTLFSTPTIKTFFDGSEFWLRGGNVYIGDGTANSTHLTVDGHIQHSSGVKYLSMAVSGSYRYVNVGDYANTSYTTITNINANTWTRWIDGSGTEIMRVDHTGNSYRLDVKGSLNATTVYQNGTTLDTLLSNYLLKSGGAITRSDRSLLLLKNTNAEGQSTLWLGGDFETFDKGGFIAYGGKTGDVSIVNFKAYNNNTNGLSAIRITSDNKVQVGDVNFTEGKVYDIYHTGNFNPANYLPLSGGTIEGGFGALVVKRNKGYASGIRFDNTNGILGYIGIAQDGTAQIWDANQNAVQIIHSGNIGDYAIKNYGNQGAIDFNNVLYNGIQYTSGSSSNNGKAYGVLLSLHHYDSSWHIVGGLKNGALLYRSGNGTANTWGDWKTIAFTDSNVASATKLQTARTIWGKSFDGTANVTGNINIGYNKILIGDGTETFYIGWGGNNQYIYNNYYGHIFYTKIGESMRIEKEGNVLIGTTSDNGCKFQVNGTTPSYFYNSRTRYSLVVDSGLASKLITFGGWNNNEKAQVGYTDGTGFNIFNYQSYRDNNGAKITAVGITNTGIFYVANSGDPGPGVATLKVETSLVTVIGNLTVTGGGAFGSDIRYKDITSYRQLNLETIANAPLFSFRWTDREDKVEHLGTSAQYWLDTQFKDAVNTTNKDFFHLDYGALAVGIGISVAREVKGVKTEVEVLRERVNQLEKELAQYRRV